jgi:hypothetical protein
MSFTVYNVAKAAAAGRRRAAMAAVVIAASFFRRAGKAAPAGVCPERSGPGCLKKLPAWLAQLDALTPAEALRLLADHVRSVPDKLWTLVEAEYNAGVRASGVPGMALLEAGSLARRAALLASLPCDVTNVHCPAVSAGIRPYRFYYIAAGVGCGIEEVQQVRATHCVQ